MFVSVITILINILLNEGDSFMETKVFLCLSGLIYVCINAFHNHHPRQWHKCFWRTRYMMQHPNTNLALILNLNEFEINKKIYQAYQKYLRILNFVANASKISQVLIFSLSEIYFTWNHKINEINLNIYWSSVVLSYI